MSHIAFLLVRVVRTATVCACLLLAAAPAMAQDQAGPSSTGTAQTTPAPDNTQAAPAALAAPVGPPVQQINVRGTQRIEPGTVLSYMTIRPGDSYSPEEVDKSLKTLFATGLFSDVKMNWNGTTLTVNVVENPIINQIAFEGESKVSEKDLTKEVQLKPRMVFTRAKVQADVQRLIELYRRNGKFAATVDPQIIQRPQNRVDLIFSINEGATTAVARINFIGNKAFDDDTLKGQIATEESAWWKFLATNDNYDPDRLTFDREQLRRFYLRNGYADFRVVSAVAELTPDRSAFYITFTLDEGQRYKFGKVVINSSIRELDPVELRPLVPIQSGDGYNAEMIDKSIDALTNAAGTRGYAFAQVHPRISRNRDTRTIDVIFNIDQGPRVYVEKINIVGNQRTLDKVIRREMRLSEGDAFNRVLVDRSRTRIRSLGFFKDVDIKSEPGSQPDKTILTVAVQEQSTGAVQLGVGYSSTSSFVGEASYTETNLFGRGQYLRVSASASSISKEFQLSFTEPYFLDRSLAAGFDLYKVLTIYDQADYESDVSAIQLRLGFPTSEYGTVGLHYTFSIDKITPFGAAPLEIELAQGTTTTSAFGYSYGYNTLDDPIKPTKGFTFGFSQEFAGFGGTLKYLNSQASFAIYHPILWDQVVASLSGSAGFINGWGGQHVPINVRYFKGADSFRGFDIAGIGPRDLVVNGKGGAVGGDAYAIGTFALRLPDFLPADYGIGTSLFTDFGTLGHLDEKPPACNFLSSCVRDNMGFRASAGVSVSWKSPFGPVQIDLAIPYVKESYDKTEVIHFSAGTGL